MFSLVNKISFTSHVKLSVSQAHFWSHYNHRS